MATPNIPPPPDWVFQRIIAVGGETGPRYEASLYGPVTCLLVSYFPVTDFFMIKPQGKICPEFINDVDDTIRTSFDSYRAEVLPRGFGGSESGVRIPYFIVVKATESKDNDRVLMLVEIKPLDRSLANSLEQLTNYLEAFSQKFNSETWQPLFDTSYGLLIIGEKVLLITFEISGRIGASGLLDMNSAPVHAFLKKIVATVCYVLILTLIHANQSCLHAGHDTNYCSTTTRLGLSAHHSRWRGDRTALRGIFIWPNHLPIDLQFPSYTLLHDQTSG